MVSDEERDERFELSAEPRTAAERVAHAKACKAAYDKAYNEANRDKKRAQKKAYAEANKEKVAARRKRYQEANREKLVAKRKAHYEANKQGIRAQQKIYRAANKQKVNAGTRAWIAAHKEQKDAYDRMYKEANREKLVAKRKAHYEANKQRFREAGREHKYKYKYKIERSVVEALIASQGNRCDICRTSFTFTNACVDHCHVSGKVRGILCGRCNSGIGFLNDDPKVLLGALRYLERYASKHRSRSSRPSAPPPSAG